MMLCYLGGVLSFVDFMSVGLLMAAGAYYFFLDKKATKNQVCRKASLRSRPLPCKSGKTGAGIACPAAHSPALFCLISPEAVLQTE